MKTAAIGLGLILLPNLAAQQPLVLKTTTKLVQVSVVVHDKSGAPLPGLTQQDFNLKVDGKPQPIRFFSQDEYGSLATTTETLPPNTFTNRLIRPGTPSSVTIILFDALNTNYADQAYARAQVIKFLETIQPGDHIGLYALGNRLRVLHEYTTDSTRLLRALAAYRGQILPNLAGSEPVDVTAGIENLDLSRAFRSASGVERDFYTTNRVIGTLKAIEFIAHHLARLPGRKNLIWVSGGFPLSIGFDNLAAWRDGSREMRDFGPELTRTVEAVNDANMAIYPVDARGLVTDHAFSAENQRGPEPAVNSRSRQTPNLPRPNPVVKTQQTMSELASRTGGRDYFNTNDLQNAVRHAVDDSRLTYTVGFYPPESNNDGKFHKIKIELVTHSGQDLRYRKGFFDFLPEPNDDKARNLELRDAIFSPLEATAAAIMVRATPSAGDQNTLEVVVAVDPSNVTLTPQDDRWDGRVDFLFAQKDEQGRQFGIDPKFVELRVKKDNYEKISREGLVFRLMVKRAPGAQELRVIVRDASSGAMGSVTVPYRDLKY
jgi:VWFA-related protein